MSFCSSGESGGGAASTAGAGGDALADPLGAGALVGVLVELCDWAGGGAGAADAPGPAGEAAGAVPHPISAPDQTTQAVRLERSTRAR